MTISSALIAEIESALDVNIRTSGLVVIPAGAEFVIVETDV
ncbi:MAG TPA: hypothetical protein VGK25_09070 [Ignavibacteria bacterium]